jgi:SAM-dependent methyltransferase
MTGRLARSPGPGENRLLIKPYAPCHEADMGKHRRVRDVGSGQAAPDELPERLAADLGPAGDLARQAVTTLQAALPSGGFSAGSALPLWQAGGTAAAQAQGGRPPKITTALADAYGLETQQLAVDELLLAVGTYYALVVKLLAWQAMAAAGQRLRPCDALLAASTSGSRRRVMEGWESGQAMSGMPRLAPPGQPAHAGDPFAWYLDAWNDAIDRLLAGLAARLARYDPQAIGRLLHAGGDPFQTLYQRLFPRRVRHLRGEYYTPSWLAAAMLDEVGYSGQPGRRLLDPACGSGAFLIPAIRRLIQRAGSGPSLATHAAALARQVTSSVAGLDLNPLAVLTARANYLLALGDALPGADGLEIPVYLGDSILGADPAPPADLGRFDAVVGNPPWIAWDDVPEPYREATKPLWRRYGLFSLSGREARHGGAKKDLSMLMAYAAADRFLAPSGKLALVVTQTLFQTKGAGDGFRRFRLGKSGPWLCVLRVNDLVAVRPFAPAANWTATLLLERDRPTVYPVPYVRWLPGDRASATGASGKKRPAGFRSFRRRAYEARPIDPDRPGSPWFLWPEGWSGPTESLFGPSDYHAHLGANSGGANGVFWLALADAVPDAEPASPGTVLVRNLTGKGRQHVPAVTQRIEAELVYPLLRWADVARYRAVPSAHLLLAQDAQTRQGIAEPVMRRQHPLAHAYLARFRSVLQRRTAFRRYQSKAAFWSMYDVGPYTVAPIKVVWRRMDRRVTAAVVEPHDDPRLGPKPVVPQETCVLVAIESSDEAHYLAAVLNSVVVEFLVGSHSVRGGKGFGTPSMLEYLRVRRFQPDNPIHAELAAASRRAHGLAAEGRDLGEVQASIDRLAARLWGLGDDDMRQMADRGSGIAHATR